MVDTAKYQCEFKLKRNTVQNEDVELLVTKKESTRISSTETTVTDSDGKEGSKEAATGAKIGKIDKLLSPANHGEPKRISPAKQTPPWHEFLGKVVATSCSPQHGQSHFSELLDEGKKRLEKARKEGSLRARAEVVGHAGDNLLDDLLSDLREPNFSRQQNE